MIDYTEKQVTKLQDEWQSAKPFPHVVIDGFLDEMSLNGLIRNFPKVSDKFYRYDNHFEKKRALDKIELLPELIASTLLAFNSGPFVDFLERVSGLEGLIPDPHFRGGGVHVIEQGGFLDVHADLGLHPRLHLFRRLNVLLYLNHNYRNDLGGRLEFWNETMTKREADIAPIANRLVIFETNATSFHGHPEPWRHMIPRQSLALYYFTAKQPNRYSLNLNSTDFRRRPFDPILPEKERMREDRLKGRLSSNITPGKNK